MKYSYYSKIIPLTFFLVFSFFYFISTAEAGEDLFYKEANLVGGYSRVDHWVGKSPAQRNSVGFEYYRKFSNDYGDFLTLDLQVRTSYDPSQNRHYAWGVEFHNAYLEYKLGLGRKVRVGHFDPAYGLEPIVDTHGTLFQTLAMIDIGFKKDWGVAYFDQIGPFDIQAMGSLGSGMGIRFIEDNFLVTGRIGWPATRSFQAGLSLLAGNTLESKQMRTIPNAKLVSRESTTKKRLGVDGMYEWRSYKFKGETSIGWNESHGVLGVLGEVDYTVPGLQNLELQLQGRFFNEELSYAGASEITLGAGFSYKITSKLWFRAAYFGDLHSYERKRDHEILFQLYYFG